MPILKGKLQIAVDGLISGLEPVVSDWQGNIASRGITAKSSISAEVQIVLRDLFRLQPYVTNGRIHLAGVDMDESRLSMIPLLLRDLGFEVRGPHAVPPSSDRREFLFTAHRLEGGDWLSVVLLVRTRQREVFVQRDDKGGSISGHRTGGDTTIEMRGILQGSASRVSQAVNIIQRKVRERLEGLRDRPGT